MFKDILSKKERFLFNSLISVWIFLLIIFWIWWFEPSHIGFLWGFILTSFVVAWPIIIFGYSFFFLVRMKRLDNTRSANPNLRVAIVVTKAPSEPFRVVQETLEGALRQKYPHDTWAADEHPSDEALEWYRKMGIHVSCRKDDAEYHNDSWPRKKKCKEGNLAYFYEKYGYERYDVVVQMDADHQPQENYLEEILKPFNDESIAYAAAPSVCDTNINSSWSARARMHSEGLFHGPIQSGSNDGWVPICIGSHYAIRTKALKEIGGIGPELAEDYSTTLLFNASHWKGAWVYDANARGEGPNSFKDLIIQDYQWARSLTILLLTLYPKLWGKLNWRQRFHFTFTQLWYGLSSLVWLLGLLLIITALLTGHAPVVINFKTFLQFAVLPTLIAFLILAIAERKGFLRPKHAHFFSWENFLFEMARWPWVSIACIDATISVLIKKKHTYVVTSKNKASSEEMPLKIIVPYIATATILALAIIFRKDTLATTGYSIFALLIACCYIALSFIALILHIKEIDYVRKIKLAFQHLPHFLSLLGSTSLIVIVGLSFGLYFSEVAVSAKTLANVVTPSPTEATSTFVEYTVRQGDTLRDISLQYLGADTKWKYIQREQDGNPNLIFPGQVVLIPSASNPK